MKVLIDGKEVEAKNDVKIIWEGDFLVDSETDEPRESELHLMANHEGIVLDVISDGEVSLTRSLLASELSEMAMR